MRTDEQRPLTLRPATEADHSALAAIHTRVRRASVPAMPTPAAPLGEPHGETWLAETDEVAIGYAVVQDAWLHSLYVLPEAQGSGVGSALLDVVKALRPDGFCLWVFETNAAAREFYARRGLVELETTDGADNDEQAPDIKMAWPGADPLGFYRSLIDDVDAQLGTLLARRAALTRAAQAHKPDAARDPEREREIAVALAARAPTLGAERLQRIVHAIITESLGAARD